jgi:uncharacterized membrane protein
MARGPGRAMASPAGPPVAAPADPAVPPRGWSAAPSYPGGYGAPGPYGPPSLARSAVDRLRSALARFRVTVVLLLLISVTAAGFVAALSRVALVPPANCGGSMVRSCARAPTVGALAGLALFGVVLLVLLIVTLVFLILSFVQWREGLAALESAATVREADPPLVGQARADHTRTWVLFVLQIVVGIAFAGTVGVLFGTSKGLGGTTALVPGSPNLSGVPFRLEGLVFAIAALAAEAILGVLSYYFAGRSHQRALESTGRADVPRLVRGRNWMVAGAILGTLGSALSLLTPFGLVVSIAYPILLIVGVSEIHGAYVAWLGGPPVGAVGAGLPAPPAL